MHIYVWHCVYIRYIQSWPPEKIQTSYQLVTDFPRHQLIAREHPKRDPRNPLINNFTFRVFMFQDMEVGDNLMITANVIGCVDAEECAAVSVCVCVCGNQV